MAKLRAPIDGIGQDDFVSSATQAHDLGTRVETDDGRVYRYALAGAVDLVAGNVLQGPAIVTRIWRTPRRRSRSGATSFTYTPGAATGTANQYAGGWLQVDTTPATATPMKSRGTPRLRLDRVHAEPQGRDSGRAHHVVARGPDRESLSRRHSVPGDDRDRHRGGRGGYVITAAQYGWIQTWGMCSTLIAGTPALGAGVMTPSTAAGSAVVLTTTNLVVAQTVGYMAQIGVDGKNNFVDLRKFGRNADALFVVGRPSVSGAHCHHAACVWGTGATDRRLSDDDGAVVRGGREWSRRVGADAGGNGGLYDRGDGITRRHIAAGHRSDKGLRHGTSETARAQSGVRQPGRSAVSATSSNARRSPMCRPWNSRRHRRDSATTRWWARLPKKRRRIPRRRHSGRSGLDARG
jgi:hypothetical protein